MMIPSLPEIFRRLLRVERLVEPLPCLNVGGSNQVTRVKLLTTVAVGQQLVAADAYGSAFYGIKKSSTTIDHLTVDVDPAGGGAIAQIGVGRGLYVKEDGTTEPVLVLNDTRAIFPIDMPQGAEPLVRFGTTTISINDPKGTKRKAVILDQLP